MRKSGIFVGVKRHRSVPVLSMRVRISAICPSWVNTDMAQNISSLDKSSMTQPEDIAEICSTILKLPTQSVPFEIALNCNYEI